MVAYANRDLDARVVRPRGVVRALSQRQIEIERLVDRLDGASEGVCVKV